MQRMQSTKRSLLRLPLALVMAAFPASAMAQDADPSKRNAGQITVYGWLAGYGGDIRPGSDAPTFSVSKGFGELLEDSDGAFFVSGYVRRGRVVFMGDLSHSSSSKDANVPTGLPSPFPPTVPAEASLKQTSLTALAGYRVADNGTSTLDLLGGVRAWWVRPELDVPALEVSRSPNIDFVDPVIAARGNIGLGKGLNGIVYADIGGLGGGSDFTMQVVGTLNVQVTKSIWLSGGYRYLVVDYQKKGIKVDSRLGGPLIGATLTF